MKVTSIVLLFLICSCKNSVKYPDGGFEYSKNIKGNDTNNYYYPLRHTETKRDLFWDCYSYLIFEPFNEPNLSLRPLSKETFRFYYSTAFGEITIVTLTNGFLAIKQGNPFDLYDTDTSKLTRIENYHLKLFRRWYPFDTVGQRPILKSYLDSLVKLYPELFNPNYYHRLYSKSLVKKNSNFTYESSIVALSETEHDLLIQEINLSGFWDMPNKQQCNENIADGYIFQLEANTANKYQVVTVEGCPNDTSKFTKACQRVIKLAKLDKKLDLMWKEPIDTSREHPKNE